MKMLNLTLAAAIATTVLGLPAAAIAQVGPDAHQPMPNDQDHRGDMSGGDMHRGDMQRGDMQRGDMNRGDMRHDEMRHDDRHGDDMRHDDMRHDDMGHLHDGHRHCWNQWRHHHRVRVCR